MTNSLPIESYSINDIQTQCAYLGERRVDRWMGFLIPFLKPGMTLLDCGCGVGTITIDLAERVAPGKVVGIDVDKDQLLIARNNAEIRGIKNIDLRYGDVYNITFLSRKLLTLLWPIGCWRGETDLIPFVAYYIVLPLGGSDLLINESEFI